MKTGDDCIVALRLVQNRQGMQTELMSFGWYRTDRVVYADRIDVLRLVQNRQGCVCRQN